MVMIWFSKVKTCRAATDTRRGWIGLVKWIREMTNAIEIIHRDHVNLDRFLNVLETVVDGLAPDQLKLDLELLYSAVYYTRVFPDRCHHPKEERYLFGAVRM